MQELTWVRSLGWEDTLEEGMATHSSSCQENPMDRESWWATVIGREGDLGSDEIGKIRCFQILSAAGMEDVSGKFLSCRKRPIPASPFRRAGSLLRGAVASCSTAPLPPQPTTDSPSLRFSVCKTRMWDDSFKRVWG